MPEAANERLDPRIARTRSLLWATLVALIEERGYAAITVRDITTRANVNRSTFYRHYEDKDDLFRQGCSDLYDSIFLRMQSLLEQTPGFRSEVDVRVLHPALQAH